MAQPSNSPARFELSPRRDSASDPKTETTGKPQSEIIKIASLKVCSSLAFRIFSALPAAAKPCYDSVNATAQHTHDVAHWNHMRIL